MNPLEKIALYNVESIKNFRDRRPRACKRVRQREREKQARLAEDIGLSLSPDPGKMVRYKTALLEHQTGPEHAFLRIMNATEGLRGKFRPQFVMAGYIIDFFCVELLLAVEVDGSSHEGKQVYDSKRTAALEALGIRVIRFKNETVLRHPGFIRNRIRSIISKLCAPPPKRKYWKWGERPSECKAYDVGNMTEEELREVATSFFTSGDPKPRKAGDRPPWRRYTKRK